jgi:hypothetical protein
MKPGFFILTIIFSGLLSSASGAKTVLVSETAKPISDSENSNSVNLANNSNICALFRAHSQQTPVETIASVAPAPVRTINDVVPSLNALKSQEIELYQRLGLIANQDGSHVCLAQVPNNSSRQFTIFKLKKINNILVISTFLEGGKFLPGQEQATTNLFLETIKFYTDIPEKYYPGIERYFQEFYLRIKDGRLQPKSDRTYPVDEPEATVVLYHPLKGTLSGTGISLNIPLD